LLALSIYPVDRRGCSDLPVCSSIESERFGRRRETKRKSPSFLSFWFGFVVASFGPRGGAHRFYKNPIFAAFSAVEIDRFPDLRLRVLAVRSEAQQSEHAASRESIREKLQILLGATEREQVTAEGKGKGGGGAGDEGCYQL